MTWEDAFEQAEAHADKEVPHTFLSDYGDECDREAAFRDFLEKNFTLAVRTVEAEDLDLGPALIDDISCTPFPEKCAKWPCCGRVDQKPLQPMAGLMVCPHCLWSYGEAK